HPEMDGAALGRRQGPGRSGTIVDCGWCKRECQGEKRLDRTEPGPKGGPSHCGQATSRPRRDTMMQSIRTGTWVAREGSMTKILQAIAFAFVLLSFSAVAA